MAVCVALALVQAESLAVAGALCVTDTVDERDGGALGEAEALVEPVGRAEAEPASALAEAALLGVAATEALASCTVGDGVASKEEVGSGELLEEGRALPEAEAQGVGEELRLAVALERSDGDWPLEKEAEAVELRDGVGLEDGLLLPESAADTLGQEALALGEAWLGVASALAQAEKEGWEALACWVCEFEAEEKEEGLVLGP